MSKIRVCTMCGQLATMPELDTSTVTALMGVWGVSGWTANEVLQARGWECPNCETPMIEIFPQNLAQSARRAQLNAARRDAPLVIEEG